MAQPLTGDEVVRRDHLARQKAGADGIRHLVEKRDYTREAREKLAVDVANIGARNRKAAIAAAKEAHGVKPDEGDGGIGTDSGDQFSEEELRGAIEVATGKAPHPNAKYETLVEKFNKLNAEA